MRDSRLRNLLGRSSLLLVASLVTHHPCPGQVPNQPPAFEVAAIRPSSPDARLTILPELRNSLFHAANISLRQLLATAFSMTGERIIGPDWLDKVRFDIVAKAPDGQHRSDMAQMLQHLLVERFRLSYHTESRELPVYDLVVAKEGIKMAVYPAPERPLLGIKTAGVPAIRGSVTIPELAAMLSAATQRTVIDKTALTEKFNVLLVYAPPFRSSGQLEPDSPPALFTAIREQLGLRLIPNKARLNVLLIDTIDRTPSEN